MAVPKRKTSKSRLRTRRAAWEKKVPKAAIMVCHECGAPRQPHRVCPSCGKYNGRQVVVKETQD